MFYEKLFNPWNKIKILGIQSTYPDKDNCYQIELTGTYYRDKFKVVIDYIPKAQVDLAMRLAETTNCLVLDDLIPFLQKFYDETYSQAQTDQSLSEADESL